MPEMTTSQKLDLAVRHYAAKEVERAAALCEEILAREPGRTEALNLLAAIDLDAGRAELALQRVRRAIQLQGDVASFHHNEGEICARLGRVEESIAAFRHATTLQPNMPEAWHGLGNALRKCGKSGEMLDAFAKASELRPEEANWQAELAGHLAERGRCDEAIAAYQRALALRPDFAEAQLNLGNVYKETGRLDEALECFDRAREARPNYHQALSNRLNTIHFHPGYGAAELFGEARRFEEIFARPLSGEIRAHANDRSADRRLRVGYVSPDFGNHCQSFFTLPLLRNHNHGQFEIYLYSSVVRADRITGEIRQHADVWREVGGVDDEQLAQRIRDDRIDILIDLTMHMANGRPMLFARKPAPIQIAWLAYPGTTGLSAMDYRLTDPYLDPPGDRDEWYAEKSVRLAETFWCYDPGGESPEVNPQPADQNSYITFGCLNNFCKVNDRTLSLWSQVLKSVANSRFILLSPLGEHRRHVLGKLGVEANRVEFVEFQPRDQYLRVYHRIDLGLDTFPYNGHTTSLDSLWMGVPMISLCGQTAVSRAGFSQLSNLGLADQFVAHDDRQFIEHAMRWTRDLPQSGNLRGSLRTRMEKSPLMDAVGFARGMESAYRHMWRTFIKQ